ncbi:MAG: adenylyltransferase/cytidyltransferase family protein [Thermodesulfovibrionales bacterium]|nr:adenylyltransferase/cytidyltransferase family protein [Thermodesulfovibrionales bacterium]
MGKVLGRDELKTALSSARSEGKTVVFTNGCFDLIHVGHIRYLKEAKGLGDVLVVAVNSDKSVSVIKPGRPVIPGVHRAEVVSALEMVDYVTLFNEDTPYELIKFLRPDVLVKGGDWRKEDIAGHDLVPVTLSLPYIEGASTTEIIEKIKGVKTAVLM